jgi:uncharacterized protein
MDEAQVFGKGISFPPRVSPDGRLAYSSGTQNIREMIRIILLTQPQERLMLPEFGVGLKAYLFKPNTVATHRLIEERISKALALWEPRVGVESVLVERDPVDQQSAVVTINYKVVATQASDQLTLTVRLTG